jgi:isopropylmalate/homocitrate/citramalate synthase
VALRVLYGIELPNFRYEKLRELARFMEKMSGIPLQQHEPIVGSKVFAHESGIHTQAMLIDHRMYEAVPKELVGGQTTWVFGKHTGASLVEDTLRRQRERLVRAGVEPSSELAQRVTEEVKRLREDRAASSKSEETIEAYELAMRRLSLDEEDVVEIAIALGSSSLAR